MRDMDDAYPLHKEAIVRVLGLEGSSVHLDESLSDGIAPDPEGGLLVVGTRMYPGHSAGMALHEFGHMMVTRDEAVGAQAWGMESPNLLVQGGEIYNEGTLGTSQVRLECRAWAWQWILEEACGLREVGGPAPSRPEARFLSSWESVGVDDDARHRRVGLWQDECRRAIEATHPDPVQAVRDRIDDLPRLLATRAAVDRALMEQGTAVERFSGRDAWVTLSRHELDGTVAWSVELETEHGHIESVTATSDEARARRFLARVVENNGFEPVSPYCAPVP